MSYDLCIWDPTRHASLPANADEALETMERLSEVADSFNPLFGEFSSALVQHHQASFQGNPTKPLDPEDTQAFWGGDPRESAARCKTAVYRLSLPSEAGTERLAYVVAAAANCGLVVFDDENGMCFLPDGTIYPEDMREIWESDLAELIASPQDPSLKKPDNRTLLQTIAMELFEAIGRGNKRIM